MPRTTAPPATVDPADVESLTAAMRGDSDHVPAPPGKKASWASWGLYWHSRELAVAAWCRRNPRWWGLYGTGDRRYDTFNLADAYLHWLAGQVHLAGEVASREDVLAAAFARVRTAAYAFGLGETGPAGGIIVLPHVAARTAAIRLRDQVAADDEHCGQLIDEALHALWPTPTTLTVPGPARTPAGNLTRHIADYGVPEYTGLRELARLGMRTGSERQAALQHFLRAVVPG